MLLLMLFDYCKLRTFSATNSYNENFPEFCKSYIVQSFCLDWLIFSFGENSWQALLMFVCGVHGVQNWHEMAVPTAALDELMI